MRLARPLTRPPPETLVALLHVVFFLLVFFIPLGPMAAPAPFDVTPPTAETGADMPSGGITVSVSASGDLAVDGLVVDDAALDQAITARLVTTSDTLVRINAHRDTELRHVLPLVSRIEALGARDVVLVVTPETAPPAR